MVAELDGAALLDAVVTVVKKTAPDKDKIRGIVEEVVDERLPRTLEVRSGDMVLGSCEEHRRPEFEEIALAIFAGVNVMVSGPAGCGKTHLAQQIANALGLRFGHISCTAGVSESRLVGRFAPIGANGQFVYVPAQFVDFYKNGGLFLFDELDAADPNVLLCINTALANGHMEIPDPACPVIERNPKFFAMAALNTWGLGANRQYVGRAQLDAATLDRYQAKFEIDYDAEFEQKAGDPEVVSFVHDIRAKIRAHGLRRIASTRAVIDFTKLARAGFSLEQIKAMYFRDWAENEKALVS